ncbi:hypothetical protein KIPB_007129 [Kipferlia bialata]|uniref:Exportin-7/Ran-binding protein 17 TPR repeats domain-containing protein n=1 Tax=Kipferlia bialata TaxID=797122 RepID=A0A9K3CZV3_9EUKA|nr:hypothetical protein KIPB_007129 [Kipferlia bialata]|eukprot:g7129.t1
MGCCQSTRRAAETPEVVEATADEFVVLQDSEEVERASSVFAAFVKTNMKVIGERYEDPEDVVEQSAMEKQLLNQFPTLTKGEFKKNGANLFSELVGISETYVDMFARQLTTVQHDGVEMSLSSVEAQLAWLVDIVARVMGEVAPVTSQRDFDAPIARHIFQLMSITEHIPIVTPSRAYLERSLIAYMQCYKRLYVISPHKWSAEDAGELKFHPQVPPPETTYDDMETAATRFCVPDYAIDFMVHRVFKVLTSLPNDVTLTTNAVQLFSDLSAVYQSQSVLAKLPSVRQLMHMEPLSLFSPAIPYPRAKEFADLAVDLYRVVVKLVSKTDRTALFTFVRPFIKQLGECSLLQCS